MNDSGSDREWTFLNRKGDEEHQSDDSGSSSDFVHVNDRSAVFYHHKVDGHSGSPQDLNQQTVKCQTPDGSSVDAEATISVPSVGGESSGGLVPESSTLHHEMDEADSEGSAPELLDSLENSVAEDSESSEPELLDEQVVSALTHPRSAETMSLADDVRDQPAPDGSDPVQILSDGVNISDKTDSPVAGSHSEVQSLDELEMAVSVPGQSDSASDVQEDAENDSQSSSGIEELAMPEEGEVDEEEIEGMGQIGESSQEAHQLTLRSVEALKREEKTSKTSDSESDFSDIVKIEQNSADGASTSHQEHHRYFRAVDLMQVSASSSSSGNSSLVSRFHFVHPLPRRHRYIYPRDEEEDTQSLPGDVDDRCESDISGVVPDDSDPDLSSISYSLDQLEIMEGDVVRSYKHRPNSSLNTFLSILALLTLFTTIGVGIGHYLGTTREVTLRGQQAVRIKEIQDEYLQCLRNQELLEAQVSITDAEKIAAVTAVWKQKYEELIIEKVELEQTMKRLEKNLEDDLLEAKNKLLANRNEAELLGNDINVLDQEYKNDKDPNSVLSKHDAKFLTPKLILGKGQPQETNKEAHLSEGLSKLEKRQSEVEEREAELKEMNKLLNQRQADLLLQETSLAQERNMINHREIRLAIGETKFDEREALLASREELLGEERSNLKKEQAKVQKEQAELRDSRTKLQEEQIRVEKKQAVMEEERARLLTEEAGVEEERARLLTEEAGVEEERAKLREEQARLHEDRTKLEARQEEIKARKGDTKQQDEQQIKYFNEFKELQEQTNLLRIENDELRQQVARLRYSAFYHHHRRDEVNMDRSGGHELRQLANNLAHENTDLKTTIAKLRYAQPLSVGNRDTNDWPHGSTDVTEDDKASIQTGTLPSDHSLYKKTSGQPDQEEDWFPIMWSYMNLLVPAIDLSDLEKIGLSSELTKPLTIQYQFIQNITSNMRFTETVKQKLTELKLVLERMVNIDHINSDASVIITDLKQIFHKEIASFQQYLGCKETQRKTPAADIKRKRFAASLMGSEPARRYREFVNKTKEGVSHLNDKIKDAWNKVKNVTGDFLKKNKVLKEFGDSVSHGMKQVRKTMETKWKKAKKHLFKNGLISGSWGWTGHKKTWSRRMAAENGCPKKRCHRCRRVDPGHSSYETHYHDHMSHETLETKQFKKSSDHQKKQSSNVDYEKYEEYWQQAEFEPDDFLQEGFFEGNNRKWHKHQNKARKLHGRLQRLTDDIFLAMDDDDVEDMYEDFEDLQEDVDGQDQPKELMTWLTCQVRWWKSRLYRKHSNEDLVKGCGRQLMQWQLRALCKPCDFSHKRCRKRQRGASQGPLCHYYQSVILPSLNQGQQGADGVRGCDSDHNSPRVLTFTVDSETPHVEGRLENNYGRLKYSLSLDGDAAPEPVWILNNTDGAFAEGPSAKWVFERAEDREAYHHNGLWMFKRGAVRDFERNKPWYYGRADHRADKRVSDTLGERQHNNGDRYNRSGKK